MASPSAAGGVPIVAKSMEPDCIAVRISVPDWNSTHSTSVSGKAASRLPFSFVSSSPFGDSQYPKVIFFGVSLSFAYTFVKFPPANTDVMISAAAAATVKILFAFMSFLLRLYIVSCHGIAFLIRSLSPPSMSSAIPPIIKIPA